VQQNVARRREARFDPEVVPPYVLMVPVVVTFPVRVALISGFRNRYTLARVDRAMTQVKE
jgi:hypothetical protein